MRSKGGVREKRNRKMNKQRKAGHDFFFFVCEGVGEGKERAREGE